MVLTERGWGEGGESEGKEGEEGGVGKGLEA